MRSYFIVSIVVAFVCACTSSQSRVPKINEGKFGAKLRSLDASKVYKIKILYESEGALPFEPIDDKQLENMAQATLIIKKFQFSKVGNKLIRSLQETTMQASDDVSLDVRWGCILYDRHNNVVLSIYLNSDGAGLVDQAKVKTDGKVLEVLRHEFRFLVDLW